MQRTRCSETAVSHSESVLLEFARREAKKARPPSLSDESLRWGVALSLSNAQRRRLQQELSQDSVCLNEGSLPRFHAQGLLQHEVVNSCLSAGRRWEWASIDVALKINRLARRREWVNVQAPLSWPACTGAPWAKLISSQTPERSIAQAAAKKKVAEAEAAPAAAVTEQPKKAMPAYMLWLKEERPKIVKKLGADGSKVTEVSKEAGKLWGALADSKKAPFEKKYAENKAKYTADLEAFKAAGGVLKARKSKTTEGAKVKVVKDPNQPKRPKSSYFIFLGENRDKIVEGMPAGFKVTEVTVEAGKQWKGLPDAKKKPYEKKAAELKKEYELLGLRPSLSQAETAEGALEQVPVTVGGAMYASASFILLSRFSISDFVHVLCTSADGGVLPSGAETWSSEVSSAPAFFMICHSPGPGHARSEREQAAQEAKLAQELLQVGEQVAKVQQLALRLVGIFDCLLEVAGLASPFEQLTTTCCTGRGPPLSYAGGGMASVRRNIAVLTVASVAHSSLAELDTPACATYSLAFNTTNIQRVNGAFMLDAQDATSVPQFCPGGEKPAVAVADVAAAATAPAAGVSAGESSQNKQGMPWWSYVLIGQGVAAVGAGTAVCASGSCSKSKKCKDSNKTSCGADLAKSDAEAPAADSVPLMQASEMAQMPQSYMVAPLVYTYSQAPMEYAAAAPMMSYGAAPVAYAAAPMMSYEAAPVAYSTVLMTYTSAAPMMTYSTPGPQHAYSAEPLAGTMASQDLFNYLDKDGDGVLSREELARLHMPSLAKLAGVATLCGREHANVAGIVPLACFTGLWDHPELQINSLGYPSKVMTGITEAAQWMLVYLADMGTLVWAATRIRCWLEALEIAAAAACASCRRSGSLQLRQVNCIQSADVYGTDEGSFQHLARLLMTRSPDMQLACCSCFPSQESQPGHSDGLLIDSRRGTYFSRTLGAPLRCAKQFYRLKLHLGVTTYYRDTICSNGNSTLAVAYRDTAVAYNVVSRDIAVAYNVVSRDEQRTGLHTSEGVPVAPDIHEPMHTTFRSVQSISPADGALGCKDIGCFAPGCWHPVDMSCCLQNSGSDMLPVKAKDWGPRAWSVDKGWRMVCWARNRLKFGWQPRWPAEDRNWCWEAVKERCHQSLRAPETWDTYREEVTRMGKAPSAVDAPFSGLLEPEVCEVHKGPPARFTLPQARAAEKWFKKHVKVYVLNLPANTERWRMISSRLGALGLTFQRVWGVDMREPTMLETAKTEGWVLPTYNIKKAQEVAYSPQFHKGSILGTVGCAAAHFKVQHQAMADGSPLALVLEDDSYLEDNFVERLWSVVTEELPCDWEVVSLLGRCAFGKCTSKHIARIQPDADEPDWRCHAGVDWGMHAMLYRTEHLPRYQDRWKRQVFNESVPGCLDIDIALASISDEVGYYAVPNSHQPGLVKEVPLGSARIQINQATQRWR
ncbi:unnamed protein product [Polarella glacialis]|uniref:Uncharacterized protein n=2 Tax=Polarella glacialis TaxID=89957 RepID=A0A813FZD4_POLGL|nr:unnamed protein product [Polarella glacialis]